LAIRCLGVPYIQGCKDMRDGIDSPGFIQFILSHPNIDVMKKKPSKEAISIFRQFVPNKVLNLTEGCLIFVAPTKNVYDIDRVMIYIGDDRCVAAVGTAECTTAQKSRKLKAKVKVVNLRDLTGIAVAAVDPFAIQT
jgi:hypothetical protein